MDRHIAFVSKFFKKTEKSEEAYKVTFYRNGIVTVTGPTGNESEMCKYVKSCEVNGRFSRSEYYYIVTELYDKPTRYNTAREMALDIARNYIIKQG